MDRNFARSLTLVLKHEGGFVNHPNDPGGPTNLGITIATYRRFTTELTARSQSCRCQSVFG
jgi:lysozyme family protein